MAVGRCLHYRLGSDTSSVLSLLLSLSLSLGARERARDREREREREQLNQSPPTSSTNEGTRPDAPAAPFQNNSSSSHRVCHGTKL